MHKQILFVSGLAAAALALLPVAAMAAAFSNGSFETGTPPGSFLTLTAPNSTDIANWTVSAGSVDYIGSYWQAADGSRSLDMNGTGAGTITQTFDTTPGATYTVTFDLSGNPDGGPTMKVLQVSAGGSPELFYYDTATHGNTKTNMKWEAETYVFTATGPSTTLTFASQIAGAYGPALDNVALAAGPQLSCPANSAPKLIETVPVNSNSATGVLSSSALANGQQYLFDSTGTWQNDSINVADTAFASTDNWATHFQGYDMNGTLLGPGEFQLQVNGAFVNWGPFSSSHEYTYLYTGTGSAVNLGVFDGNSNTNTKNPSWYGDNVGTLSVKIYQCVPPPPATACNNTSSAPAGYTLQKAMLGSYTYTLSPFTMFVGVNGNYNISGPAGNYIVCLKNGNSTVTLGNGNDTIKTGNGNQNITVGAGSGTITVGNGNSMVTTGTGSWTITAGNGNSTLHGGGASSMCHVGNGLSSITSCTVF